MLFIRIKILYILIFVFVISFNIFAEDIMKMSSMSPVKIQADTMKYYGDEKKSVFIGNVVAVNDDFTLTANEATVLLNNELDIDKIICNENVNLKTKDIVSMSKNAELTQATQIAVLSGGVKVWQGQNFLEGEKIIIFYAENRILVEKGKQSRVTIIFKPEEKERN